MPQNKKTYWKSLAERDALLDPTLPPPQDIPEAGIMDEGLASGVAGLIEGANELRMDRASFLKLMGFSFAGAALAGCGKAAEKALPYLVQPEDAIPGKSTYYASVCGGCSAGCGVWVKDRDGRPMKLEGNPGHPVNHGALCGMGQASVLGVYDTHRLHQPTIDGQPAEWSALDAAILAELKSIRSKKGKVRVVSRTVVSPTLKAQIAAFLAAHPGSKHVVYDPLSSSAILDAHLQTHGRRLLPHYRFDRADVIASFDADFLGTWISPVEFAGAYQSGRRLRGREGRFSKHFHIESGLTVTGSRADVRSTVKPSQLTAALAQLAVALGAPSAWAAGTANPVDAKHFDALVAALKGAPGRSLVVSGSQDLQAQLITNWLNHRLNAYGATVDVARPSFQRQGDDAAVAELMAELAHGDVQAVIVVDADPVAELAQGKALAEALKKVPLTVSLAQGDDDTSAVVRFRSPDHHWLESWSDAEPLAGLTGLVQPAVRPLYRTRQAIESFAVWADGASKGKTALELVQGYWKSKIQPSAGKGRGFEAFWDDTLLAGYAEHSSEGGSPSFREPKVSASKAADSGMELVFYPKITLQDGRHAVNPWVQEVPDPINKIAWDQTVAVNPETGKRLGLEEGDVVRLSFEGADQPLVLPVHLQPGQDPGTFSVPMGYGRAGTERFHGVGPKWLLAKPVVSEGQRLGVNVAPYFSVSDSRVQWHRGGAKLESTGKNMELACTQLHQSLWVPDRLAPQAGARVPIVQEMELADFRKGAEAERHEDAAEGSLYAEHEYPGHRWAMAIDLTACNGCSACVVACQVENNVPVVGRDEVRRAHEMHWIRIDRYYHDGPDGLETISQPMMCQQCGHAPCEPVCPVDATTHSSEGINMQTYNRCVGTRYCANNCPYKVRRFNWFDYPSLQGSETLSLNPDVTVRSRGVMEKCNFCVQRVQEKKAEAKRRGEDVADGQIKTACQQTCPAQAITFGDINDPKSEVSALAGDVRAFKVLEELNVKPSVTYLAQVRNKS